MKIFVFIVLTGFINLAQANTVGLRGGGSECVNRFIRIGKVIENNLQQFPVDRLKLAAAIRDANIVAVDSEYIVQNGEQFYATNEPEIKKISLSLKWCDDSLNPKLKNTAIIVMHEYLGLSQPGLDKNYDVSNFLYENTQLTAEEFYYLAMTNGKDKTIVETLVFDTVRIIRDDQLELTSSSNADQSARIFCELVNNSFVIISSYEGLDSVVNLYTIKSADYCKNKIKEFAYSSDLNKGLKFTLGLDSKTVYEITNSNLQRTELH